MDDATPHTVATAGKVSALAAGAVYVGRKLRRLVLHDAEFARLVKDVDALKEAEVRREAARGASRDLCEERDRQRGELVARVGRVEDRVGNVETLLAATHSKADTILQLLQGPR
jgi:hypothetical protein